MATIVIMVLAFFAAIKCPARKAITRQPGCIAWPHGSSARQALRYHYNVAIQSVSGRSILSHIVAILEDDQAQSQLIEAWLVSAGYTCHQYSTGQALLDAVQTITFDILLIDWELPDIKGPDVMSKIRNEMHMEMPVVFITSRDSEQDIVNALNNGADDYLVKPVRQFEFLARVKANTRKKPINNNEVNQDPYPPYRFNSNNQQASLHGHNIELSSKEFELAYFLFCNEGKLLERKHIQSNVWKQDADLNTRTVDTHISIIRKKLSITPDNGWRLKSVYGHGYRLERLG